MGWRVFFLERVLSFNSAMVSSELVKRMAPLKSPSLSLEATRAARDCKGSWVRGLRWLGEADKSGSASSRIVWLSCVARLSLRWPSGRPAIDLKW